jgi:hypothetical protein
MPFETVQWPPVGDTSPTQISVHWTKSAFAADASRVELDVTRHDLKVPVKVEQLPPGEFATADPTPRLCSGEWGEAPAFEPIPVGAIKIGDGQIACKTSIGNRLEADQWAVWRVRETCTEVTTCTEGQVMDWPIVHYPDGRPVAAHIRTNGLNRNEINRLIRVLRKARDDAYGRDE